MSEFDPARLALLLRQRLEIGAGELYLTDLDRETLVTALGRAELHAAAPRVTDADRTSSPTVDPAAVVRPAAAAPRGRPEAPVGAAASGSAGSAGTRDAASGPGVAGAEKNSVHLVPPRTDDLDYGALKTMAEGCVRCGLHETRENVVFSDGNPDAELVVVGEAPGANEDRTGVPFVGAAGKLLDLMLASVDLSREESVYICNVIKCRPPGNRNPTPEEIRTCSPYLHRQLTLVKPRALLAVGTFAAQLLTGRDAALGKLRGQVYSYEGVPLVVTYHPAALLRNSGWARPTWDDLQLLRQVMAGDRRSA